MQGRNSLAVQEIVKKHAEDDGFLSFEEAFKCTVNEDETLQPELHAAVIHLVRGLLESTYVFSLKVL